MPKLTGAEALTRQLGSEGVDTVFALPGVQIMSAFEALYAHRDTIRLIHTRHEQATTYMADGYAKATGKVGVAMVVPGPGALNAAAGLGTAYASSSPVLLISGQIPSTSLGKRRGELHEIAEQLDVFKPITKWNHRVTRMQEIPEAVHEAFRQLETGRPGPVELEIPPDALAESDAADIIDADTYPRMAPEPSRIERAAQLLATAERPAIIAGGGTVTAGASRELVALAELLQAPVITNQQSKGVIPDAHPLHLGVNYILTPVEALLRDTDVLLCVGTRLLIRDADADAMPTIIHIDIDGEEIGKNFETEVGIVADAREALQSLLQRLGSAAARGSRAEEIADRRAAFRDEIRALAPDQTAIVDVLRSELADDAIVVSGVTNIGYWSTIMMPINQPRCFITSSYFGTLGYAFPTALGAKVANPGRQVVALCGDGGFLYSPQEFSTAVRYGINVVAIVFNNNAYGASRWDQMHRFDEHFIGTDLHNPDFMKLADACGVAGIRTRPEELGASLREALSVDAPVLLEVEVPIMMPPFQVIR
ncbi:MAG: thiamine pyrophosphate-binding protein [Gammaproteobacteria bacterium]|nr:MAG: thiamine pyrophosphate-binding protein [Gammaproteobacteria bacterium]